jgi:hypothetical protein
MTASGQIRFDALVRHVSAALREKQPPHMLQKSLSPAACLLRLAGVKVPTWLGPPDHLIRFTHPTQLLAMAGPADGAVDADGGSSAGAAAAAAGSATLPGLAPGLWLGPDGIIYVGPCNGGPGNSAAAQVLNG